jgi:hypothetical protein
MLPRDELHIMLGLDLSHACDRFHLDDQDTGYLPEAASVPPRKRRVEEGAAAGTTAGASSGHVGASTVDDDATVELDDVILTTTALTSNVYRCTLCLLPFPSHHDVALHAALCFGAPEPEAAASMATVPAFSHSGECCRAVYCSVLWVCNYPRKSLLSQRSRAWFAMSRLRCFELNVLQTPQLPQTGS